MTLLALVALLLGATLLWLGRRTRASTGLPQGAVVFRDTTGWEPVSRSLVSHRYRLAGRPDYLVEEGAALIPVEVKPTRTAAEPYESDIIQLLAYCLLVEEQEGRSPPYGLLIYAEQQWKFPYTRDARTLVLETLAALEEARMAREVARSHTHAGRCRACSQREHCTEALI